MRATMRCSDAAIAGMARSYSRRSREGAPMWTKSADKRRREAPRSSCPSYQEIRPVPFVGPTWRLLSGFEALNGIMLVDWSTAFFFAVLQRIWQAGARQGP